MESSDNVEPRKRAAETMPTANPGLLGFRTARRREPQLFAAGTRRQTHHSPEASRAQPCLAPPAAKMTCRPTPVAAATSARSPGGDLRFAEVQIYVGVCRQGRPDCAEGRDGPLDWARDVRIVQNLTRVESARLRLQCRVDSGH